MRCGAADLIQQPVPDTQRRLKAIGLVYRPPDLCVDCNVGSRCRSQCRSGVLSTARRTAKHVPDSAESCFALPPSIRFPESSILGRLLSLQHADFPGATSRPRLAPGRYRMQLRRFPDRRLFADERRQALRQSRPLCSTCGQYTSKSKSGLLSMSWQR